MHLSKLLIALGFAAVLGASPLAQAADGGLPAAKTQGDVSYVSGGIGKDESDAFKSASSQWPLALQFSGQGGEYVADVHVTIEKSGASVFAADATGPYMLVKLAPGKYTVRATYKSSEQKKDVTVGSGGAKAAFRWN